MTFAERFDIRRRYAAAALTGIIAAERPVHDPLRYRSVAQRAWDIAAVMVEIEAAVERDLK